jgi:mannose-6-phosphate isomerase-like protein (cupin superfamily)
MTYLGEYGDVSAVVRNDLPQLSISPTTGTACTFVAPGSITNGEYGLFRWDMPPNVPGAGAHFHRRFSEAFYVLSGTVTFENGAGQVVLSEGGFLYVPPGGIHGFANPSDQPASMLILFSPGISRERYFEELSEIRHSGRELTDEEWADLFARHDQVNL